MKPTPGKTKAYIVRRLHWEYNDNWWDIRGDVVVKAYEDREYAELVRAELEDEARQAILEKRKHAPARFLGGLWRASSLDEEDVVARLEGWRLPLPPAAEGRRDWGDHDWWCDVLAIVSDASSPRFYARVQDPALSDDERSRILAVRPDDLWALFDRARFYEVVEVELEEEPGEEPDDEEDEELEP